MLVSNRRLETAVSTPLSPGRYYVDPVCRADDDTDPTDQGKVPGATSGHVVTGRYNLPSGLTCSRCIVQMVYCESTLCHGISGAWATCFVFVHTGSITHHLLLHVYSSLNGALSCTIAIRADISCVAAECMQVHVISRIAVPNVILL